MRRYFPRQYSQALTGLVFSMLFWNVEATGQWAWASPVIPCLESAVILLAQANSSGAKNNPPKKPPLQTKSQSKKPETKRAPFVIRETFQQQSPAEDETVGIVGIDLLIEPNHYPVVKRVFPGTPAQKQGIRVGDVLLAVNGTRTFNKSLWEVDALISDQPGELVQFSLLRGEQIRKVTVVVESLHRLSTPLKQPFLPTISD